MLVVDDADGLLQVVRQAAPIPCLLRKPNITHVALIAT